MNVEIHFTARGGERSLIWRGSSGPWYVCTSRTASVGKQERILIDAAWAVWTTCSQCLSEQLVCDSQHISYQGKEQ